MLFNLMIIVGSVGVLCIIIGFAWIRHMAHDDDMILLHEDYEVLGEQILQTSDDDSGTVITYPRHWRDDFLENWEARNNREAINRDFDTLRFHTEVESDFAQWQLEMQETIESIRRIGSEYQWSNERYAVVVAER